MSSGSSSDSEDDLGTSASVQEEKREFEAGLSDLRHKLAQEVIMEEEEGTYLSNFNYTLLLIHIHLSLSSFAYPLSLVHFQLSKFWRLILLSFIPKTIYPLVTYPKT